jgi:hypothetical protein
MSHHYEVTFVELLMPDGEVVPGIRAYCPQCCIEVLQPGGPEAVAEAIAQLSDQCRPQTDQELDSLFENFWATADPEKSLSVEIKAVARNAFLLGWQANERSRVAFQR